MTTLIRTSSNIDLLADLPPEVWGDHLLQVLVEEVTHLVVASDSHFRNSRIGGRLTAFSQNYMRDSRPFRTVKMGLTWKWCQLPPPFKPFFQAPSQELNNYVQDLLEAGAIEPTNSLAFQGPVFSVPKKN